MSEPTPRQVLYALVAAGFLLVVVVLTVGAGVAGLVPTWWSVTLGVLIVGVGGWLVFNWRRTGYALLLAIGLFVVWTVGTLIVAD